jgi:inosine/xanthosine triphosphatase
MRKVIIASKNPVKIDAVKKGFELMFNNEEFEYLGVSVSSGVSDQPSSDEETFIGAKNRVDNSFKKIFDADFYVGLEGGIESVGVSEKDMESFAWIVIMSNGKYGKSRTGTFFLPQKIITLIKEGKELGEADDIVFGQNNSKQGSGAVGILTGNIIDRTKYYTEAVILALISFKNDNLY